MLTFSSSELWRTNTSSWLLNSVTWVRILRLSAIRLSVGQWISQRAAKLVNAASSLLAPVLIYEPDNPEASEFLPLIQKKLLEGDSCLCTNTLGCMLQTKHQRCCLIFPSEQHAEKSNEEESDEDDDDIDSGSDEDPSHSSSCSSSSASDDNDHGDDYEKENHVYKHKPCPPAHIYP